MRSSNGDGPMWNLKRRELIVASRRRGGGVLGVPAARGARRAGRPGPAHRRAGGDGRRRAKAEALAAVFGQWPSAARVG